MEVRRVCTEAGQIRVPAYVGSAGFEVPLRLKDDICVFFRTARERIQIRCPGAAGLHNSILCDFGGHQLSECHDLESLISEGYT